MSTFSKRLARLHAVSCTAGALTLGCFNVEQVDPLASEPQRIQVDYFEDGDTLPMSELFAPWTCYRYNDLQRPPKCSIVSGFEGGLGLSITFELQVPPGYIPDDIGVGYGVPTITAHGLDATSLSRVGFDMRWDTDSSELNGSGVVTIHLPCTSLQTSPAAPAQGFSVELEVAPSHEWTHYTVALQDFAQPHWPTARIDKRRCLPVLDGVFFILKASWLAGGQLATGTMTIDNVYLE